MNDTGQPIEMPMGQTEAPLDPVSGSLVATRPEAEKSTGLLLAPPLAQEQPPLSEPRPLRGPVLFELLVAGVVMCGVGHVRRSDEEKRGRFSSFVSQS